MWFVVHGIMPSSIVVHHSFFAGGRSGKFLCRELLGSGLLSHVYTLLQQNSVVNGMFP